MKLEDRMRRALDEQADLVEVGPRPDIRELQTRTGRRRWRTGALAAAVALVAVAVSVGVFVTMTQPAPSPLIDLPPEQPPVEDRAEFDISVPVPVDARILAIATSSLALVDLDAGRTTIHRLDDHGVELDYIDSATLTGDGTIIVWGEGATVVAFRPDDTTPLLVHRPAHLAHPPEAAPAVSVAVTLDGQRLWVVQQGTDTTDEPIAGHVELVDLATGTVEHTTELPPNSTWADVTPRGLVLNTHTTIETDAGYIGEEGSHRVFELTLDGQINDIGPGEALAASATWIALRTCDQYEPPRGCALEFVDTATGERRPAAAPTDGDWHRVAAPLIPTNTPRWNATSTDGRILLGLTIDMPEDGQTRGSDLVAVHPDRPDDPDVLHRFDDTKAAAAWDTTGTKIVTIEQIRDGTGDLTVIDLADSSTQTVHDALPPGHHPVAIH